MSTKLFNGHEIVGHTLESFLPELFALQTELDLYAQNQANAFMTRIAVAQYDACTLGMSPAKAANNNYLFEGYKAFDERQSAMVKTRRRDPAVDFGFEVCVFPVESRLLALTFTEQRAFREIWAAKPWRRDFAFWDNVDADESVSEKDWEERGRLWSLALPSYQPPSHRGYSLTLVPENQVYLLPDDEQVLTPHIPALDARVNAMLLPYLMHQLKAAGLPEPKGFSALEELKASSQAQTARVTLCETLLPELTARKLRGVSA